MGGCFTTVLLVGMFAAADGPGQDAQDPILDEAESRLRAIYEPLVTAHLER